VAGQLILVARGEHRRGHAAARERALDRRIVGGGEDRVEGERAQLLERERHLDAGGQPAQLVDEPVAQAAAHPVGGHQRTVLHQRPRVARVGRSVDHLADQTAQAAVGGQLAAQAEHGAATPQRLQHRP
jgi:hypothetical protein